MRLTDQSQFSMRLTDQSQVGEQFNVHCKKLWPLLVEKLTVVHSEILNKIGEFCADHGDR